MNDPLSERSWTQRIVIVIGCLGMTMGMMLMLAYCGAPVVP